LVLIAAPMPFAHACSCGGGDPREMLQHADGAFIGTVVSGRDAAPPDRKVSSSGDPWDWTFRVEETIKGDIGDEVVVRSGLPSGGTCGLDLKRGQRVGLLLERYDGVWRSGSCSIVGADELHRAGQPPPTPDGLGPPAFLAATTGEHSVVTLDGQGRVLRYGDGKDHVRFDMCRGGRWAAEVDEMSGFVDGRPYIALGRRSVETLELRDAGRLVPLELPEPDEPFSVGTISCRNPTASDVYVFAEHPGSGHDLLLRVTDGKVRRILKEHIGAVAFSRVDEVAFVTTGKAGRERDLVALDLRTLDRRRIATLSGGVWALDVDATGTRILGRAVLDVRTESGRPSVELFTVGMDGENLRTRKAMAGNAVWVGDHVAATRWDAGLDIFDAQLRLLTSEPRWEGGITPVGDRIFGAWNGTLRYTDTTGKPIRPLSDLNLTLSSLTEVPQAGDAVSPEAQRPKLTWTAIALLVLLVALTAIIIRSRRTPAPDREPSEQANP
jgi:hypothetical protein